MSKYVEIFQATEKDFPKPPILDSDVLFVRVLELGEIKTKSGLIAAVDFKGQVNTLNSTQPIFAEVLKTGKGYYKENDDGTTEDVPLEVQPGDIIAVGQNAAPVMLRYGNLLQDGLKVAYVRASEIIERWPAGTYDAYFSALTEKLGAK
jgi:hypothetical protein